MSKGKELFRLSLVNYGNIEKIPLSIDETITAMAYDTDTSIAVATDSGKGEMQGNVYFMSTASETLGEVEKTYSNVGGIIVDMVFKNK